ncbi:MAG: hypothetical protein AB7S98_24830 [Burkholderiaceae bacterium]
MPVFACFAGSPVAPVIRLTRIAPVAFALLSLAAGAAASAVAIAAPRLASSGTTPDTASGRILAQATKQDSPSAHDDAAPQASTVPKLQISREQLADRVAERFPLGIRLFGAFTLVASSPRLNLLPQNNRIGTEVDLRAGEGSPPGLPRGVLGVSYGLRYQADDASVRLTAVRAERIEVGPVSLLQQQAGPAAAAIVGEALTDLTVYTLSAAQRQLLHGLGMEPDSFTVTNEAVVIKLRRKPL